MKEIVQKLKSTKAIITLVIFFIMMGAGGVVKFLDYHSAFATAAHIERAQIERDHLKYSYMRDSASSDMKIVNPPIIGWLLGAEAFAWSPWVVVGDKVNVEDDCFIKKHEDLHIKRQGSFWGAFLWALRYFANHEFRFEEEKLAFIEQFNCMRRRGRRISFTYFRKRLKKLPYYFTDEEISSIFNLYRRPLYRK